MPFISEQEHRLDQTGLDVKDVWEQLSDEKELGKSLREFESRRENQGISGFWLIGRNFGFRTFFEIDPCDPRERTEIGHLITEENGETKAVVACRWPNWLSVGQYERKADKQFFLTDVFAAGLSFEKINAEILEAIFKDCRCAATGGGFDLYHLFGDEESFNQLGGRGIGRFLDESEDVSFPALRS